MLAALFAIPALMLLGATAFALTQPTPDRVRATARR